MGFHFALRFLTISAHHISLLVSNFVWLDDFIRVSPDFAGFLWNITEIWWSSHYTLCSEKNTHSRFLLYLREKCLDFHKIIRECLKGMKYSTGGKIKHSFPPMTSWWRHTTVFGNYEFYSWRQTFDEMFASQEGLWSHKFVRDVSGQWMDNWTLMEWNF